MHTHQTLTLVVDVLRDSLNEFDQSGQDFSTERLDEFNLRHLALEKLQTVRGYICGFTPEISKTVREVLVVRARAEAQRALATQAAWVAVKEAMAGVVAALQQDEPDQAAATGQSPLNPWPSKDVGLALEGLKTHAALLEQATRPLSDLYQFRDQEFTFALDLLASHSVSDAIPRAQSAVQQSGHGEDLILVLEARALLNAARLLDDRLAELHRVHSRARSKLAQAKVLLTAVIEGLSGGPLRSALEPDDLKALLNGFCEGCITNEAVKEALRSGNAPASSRTGDLLEIGQIAGDVVDMIDIGEIAGDVVSGIGKALSSILD